MKLSPLIRDLSIGEQSSSIIKESFVKKLSLSHTHMLKDSQLITAQDHNTRG
jgi:hypothetical protein